VLLALVIPRTIRAADDAMVIRNISPDKKFAMAITCDGTPADPDNIDSALIKSISLVSMPGKKVVAKLLPDEDVQTHFEDMKLLWSSDSKWCAFYYAQPRIGYTSVLHLSGDKFVLIVRPMDLRIPYPKNASVRREFISPVKWNKPGELVLNQDAIMHNNAEDSDRDFTAVFDAAKRKFSVVSKD
jgi:hypothetical protein